MTEQNTQENPSIIFDVKCIESALEDMTKLDEAQASALAMEIKDKQPHIFNYMLYFGQHQEHLQQAMVDVAVIYYLCTRKKIAAGKMKLITEQELTLVLEAKNAKAAQLKSMEEFQKTLGAKEEELMHWALYHFTEHGATFDNQDEADILLMLATCADLYAEATGK